jgi:hypothetical protein
MSYTGWLLPELERVKFLMKFPPHYHDIIAHHVTLGMGELPMPVETTGQVVGTVDDNCGIQALVISINGSTKRPDGKIWHVTWSIDRDTFNRKPVDSNDVLKNGWVSILPIDINLIPMVFTN